MIQYHRDLIQGSDEWHAARCGLLTASEMKLILTPTLKIASNDKERAHLYELLAQRITRHVEPHYVGDDMLRGREDEIDARTLYAKHYAPVEEVGFITNDKWGFTIGCSPDGMIGDAGLIECKGRRQKFQAQTIIDARMPEDFLLQVQTALLVSEREWLDFISYSAGMPMVTLRIYPDEVTQQAIIDAATAFEARLEEKSAIYMTMGSRIERIIPTERRVEMEMFA